MSKTKGGILKFCKAVGNNDCENDDNIVALQYCPHIWQLNAIGVRAIFCQGGGKPFAQKILASCPNFYKTVEKKRGPYVHTMQ